MRRLVSRAAIGFVVTLVACSSASFADLASTTTTTIAAATTSPSSVATTTTKAVGTTTSTTFEATTTTTVPQPPSPGSRYSVQDNEVALEAKQLAAEIVYDLTTYERWDDPLLRYLAIAGSDGLLDLATAAAPLTLGGHWSRGEVVYPQLGGLTDDKVSLMTVTRQTVGIGPDPLFSVTRTLDVRLVMGEDGWEFDFLASAGGVFDSLEDLATAHEVAADPRIEMADSARLDILSGLISPRLLSLMLEIADITPYAITVMATGHPYHVFETNRVSHHTIGRAIDIHRVGDNLVIDDREPDTLTRELVQLLWQHPRVVQVGSPWDVDAPAERRAFQNTVHQDHIHVAVIGPNDPDWFPAIGNRVWEDLDGDGIQDEGEPGIAGVDVTLFDAGGRAIRSAETSSYGELRVPQPLLRELPRGGRTSPADGLRRRGTPGVTTRSTRTSTLRGSWRAACSTLASTTHGGTPGSTGSHRSAIGCGTTSNADGIQDEGEPGLRRTSPCTCTTVRGRWWTAHGHGLATAPTASRTSLPGVYSLEIFRADGYVPTLQDQGDPDPG